MGKGRLVFDGDVLGHVASVAGHDDGGRRSNQFFKVGRFFFGHGTLGPRELTKSLRTFHSTSRGRERRREKAPLFISPDAFPVNGRNDPVGRSLPVITPEPKARRHGPRDPKPFFNLLEEFLLLEFDSRH